MPENHWECQRCRAVWQRKPNLVHCASCGDELCPECEPVRCECGGLFCVACRVETDDGTEQGLTLCLACSLSPVCEWCGEAPADLLLPEPVCARCALS